MISTKPTIAHMLGEIVWVCSQSPIYKNLKISDIEWLLMPPILLEQYRVFHNDKTPVGFALWALLSEEVEKRINDNIVKGVPVRLTPQEWKSGDRLWLIELVCPTATQENNLSQHLMADLVNSAFKDKAFYFHQMQMETGLRKMVKITPPIADDAPMTMQ